MPDHAPIEAIVALPPPPEYERKRYSWISEALEGVFERVIKVSSVNDCIKTLRFLDRSNKTFLVTSESLPRSNPTIRIGKYVLFEEFLPEIRAVEKKIAVLMLAIDKLSSHTLATIKEENLYSIQMVDDFATAPDVLYSDDCDTDAENRFRAGADRFLAALSQLSCQTLYGHDRALMTRELYGNTTRQGNALAIVCHQVLGLSFPCRVKVSNNILLTHPPEAGTVAECDVVLKVFHKSNQPTYHLVECKNEGIASPPEYAFKLAQRMGVLANAMGNCEGGFLVSLGGFEKVCRRNCTIARPPIVCVDEERLKDLLRSDSKRRCDLIMDWFEECDYLGRVHIGSLSDRKET